MQAPVALPRCFAEILCPVFGFGSLREFRPRCQSFTVIHQVLPQNCASSVRKIYSQITLVQLCGITLNFFVQKRVIGKFPAGLDLNNQIRCLLRHLPREKRNIGTNKTNRSASLKFSCAPRFLLFGLAFIKIPKSFLSDFEVKGCSWLLRGLSFFK